MLLALLACLPSSPRNRGPGKHRVALSQIVCGGARPWGVTNACLSACLLHARRRKGERERERESRSRKGGNVAVPFALSCAVGRGLGGGACLLACMLTAPARPCSSLLHASLACLPACRLASLLHSLSRQRERKKGKKMERAPLPWCLPYLPACVRLFPVLSRKMGENNVRILVSR